MEFVFCPSGPARLTPTLSPMGERERASTSVSGPQADHVADGEDEVGAVHRVEVEVADAALDQVQHLLGGHRGGDQRVRLRIVVEPVEALGQPGRHRRRSAPEKFATCVKLWTGRMPGTIGM